VRALCGALQDPDAGVRRKAAQALGRQGSRQAVPRLIEALGDSSPRVRSQAAAALKAITGWRYGEDQKRWRRWWNRQGGG
jgi:HEAT repeat protein